MSIIWKFMNRTSWRTKCSRYCVMERRYSHDSAFTERYTPRRKPLYLLPSGEVTTFLIVKHIVLTTIVVNGTQWPNQSLEPTAERYDDHI